jgi:hypothetical protein
LALQFHGITAVGTKASSIHPQLASPQLQYPPCSSTSSLQGIFFVHRKENTMLLHTMFVKKSITPQEPIRCALLHRRDREALRSLPRPPLETQEGRCA